ANVATQDPLVETPVLLPEQVEVVPSSEVPAVEAMAASAVQQTASAVVAAPVAGLPAAPLLANKSAAEAKPAAAVVPAAAVTPAVKPGKVHLVFDKDSWVEVKDKSGKTVTKGLYKAGQELNLDGEAPFSLLVGHAASAHLSYRGKPVDLAPYINASSDVARLTLE
ncbi:MAG: DUF4115 domain-containing protein, partial [Gallionella sp.]|nr:DUF4115 domain-containing protein [Gallionella sp.]